MAASICSRTGAARCRTWGQYTKIDMFRERGSPCMAGHDGCTRSDFSHAHWRGAWQEKTQRGFASLSLCVFSCHPPRYWIDEKCGGVQPTNADHAVRRRSGGLSMILAPWLQGRRPYSGERRCARSPVVALVNGRVRAATLSGSATWQEDAALEARPGLIDRAPTFDDDAAWRVGAPWKAPRILVQNAHAHSAASWMTQDPRYSVLVKVCLGACLSRRCASA